MNLYQPTITGSLSVSGSINISGSISIAGGGTISGTASIATTALTASSADNFLTRGTLTAQTLVVQTITSSVDFVTGSTRFGSLLANTHVFSGSVTMNPGGLFVSGSGLVGIGTTNPSYALDISGQTRISSTYPQLTLSGSDVLLTMYDTFQPYAYSMGVGYNKNYAFEIIDRGVSGTSNSTVFIITGSYVGINTLTPARALNVVSTAEQLRLGYDSGTTYTDFRCDSAGGLLINTANNYIINYIGGVEKMRITSATTNSQVTFTNSTAYSTSNTYSLTYRSSTISYGVQPIADIIFATEGDAASSIRFQTRKDAPDYAERMRITNSGYTKMSNDGTYYSSTGIFHEIRQTLGDNIIIFHNTNATPYGLFINFTASPNGTGNRFLTCYDGNVGTKRAEIYSNGGLANYSGNNVNLASDIRLKRNIVPLSNEWDKLKQIEIVNFKYKDSTDETALFGAIAQQVQEIYPELVIVTREATETEPEYYGLREQPFQWLTTKVLQEAMAKIETLQAEFDEYKATHP